MEVKLTAAEIADYHKKDVPCSPTIGFKMFEPNESTEELSTLQSHLKAAKELVSFKKVQKLGALSEAIWHPELHKAEVIHQVGSYWSFMGHTMDKKLYLYPEEALYLLEMGALELRYNDVPVSTQRAYTALLEPLSDVSEECYRVYSHLNANGYKVLRHRQSNILTKYEKQLQIHKSGIKSKTGNVTGKRDNSSNEFEEYSVELKRQKPGNLTEKFPVLIKSDDENNCLKQLQIFEPYKSNRTSTLSIKYDAYLSSHGKNTFKKSCLQLPKVRIVVHRSCDPMPDLKELYHLVHQFEDEVPIVHAIVFPGSISFYNITPVSTPACD